MLNPPAFSLNNRSSSQKVSSRKNEVKRAYTPATSQKKQTSHKKDEKILNRSTSKMKNQSKNISKSAIKTPKKEPSNPEKTTTKKQQQYKESKFVQMSTAKSKQIIPDKHKNVKIDKCQTESQRYEMLKQFLNEDAEKIKHMKILSNQHVLSEMKLTQDNMKRKLHDEHLSNSFLIQDHRKQVQQLKNVQAQLIKKHEDDVKSISRQLNEQKMRNRMLENQVKECNTTIANLKSRLEVKQKEFQFGKHREESIIPEAQRKISKLETEVTELESKVTTFASIKKELQAEIARHKKQKQYIKKQSQEVLQFIRNEYSKYQPLTF